MTLTQRLFLLVIVALLPAVAIQGYNELDLRRSREAEVRAQALQQAKLAASELDRILEGVRGVLTTVAAVPAVRALDAPACDAFLAALQPKVPYLVAIAAIGRDGQIRCRDRDAASPTSLADRPYFQEAIAGGQFVVGRYTDDQLIHRPTLPLALPLRDGEGAIEGIVVAALDLDWLTDRMHDRGVSEGGSITLADRDGVILARDPLRERFIGTRIPDAYLPLVTAAAPGALELTSQDGTRRTLGYVPATVSSRGIYVSAGLSSDLAFAAVQRATERGIALIAAGAVLALLAAWLAGRYFLRRPVRRLLAAAEAWRRGDYTVRTGLQGGRGEFGQLGEAFDRMVEAFAARRAEQALANAALREREERLRITYENAPVGIDETDLEGRFVAANARYCEITGYAREELIGRHFSFITHPEDVAADVEQYRRLLAGEIGDYRLRKRYVRKDGRVVWIDLVSTLVRDDQGRPSRGIAIAQDVTDRVEAEASLRDSEARLRVAIEAGRMGSWDFDIAADRATWSAPVAAMFGLPAADTLSNFEGWQARIHPEDRTATQAAFFAAVAGGGSEYETSYRVLVPGGEDRWLACQARIMRNEQGTAVRVIGVAQDVTQRRIAEAHQKMLLDELNHRVKNTLASVQSIAHQSRSGAQSPDGFYAAFNARLLSLSRAHDLLSRDAWRGAWLGELVTDTLAPYRGEGDDRIRLDGPPLRVRPNAAVALGMSLHELATNAAKYGALSRPGGRVTVEWREEAGSDGPLIVIAWRETGGPPVVRPSRRGFGSRLIERGLPRELGGTVELAFRPEGVACTIRVPLARSVSAA
jgi:PAS domain S-box-containing protein